VVFGLMVQEVIVVENDADHEVEPWEMVLEASSGR